MTHTALKLALGASLGLIFSASALAQTAVPKENDQVDQKLSGQRTGLKAAIRSGDPKRVSSARSELRSAYGKDWRDDHPRTPRTSGADQRLAAAKEQYEAVFKTGNKAEIAKARVKLRAAYAAYHARNRR